MAELVMLRPSFQSLTQRVSILLVFTLCSAGLAACKKKPPPVQISEADPREEPLEPLASATPRVPAAAPSPGPVATRCHELPHSPSFRVGEVAPRRRESEQADDGGADEIDEVPDPYSVELGQARADADGFAVSALRSIKGQTHALIALVAPDASSGKTVDLGLVHGDPDPPLFAAHGKDLVLVTPDSDAGGGMLKLALLRDPRGSAQLSWGAEISGVRRDSTFALESSANRALLAYAAEAAGKIRVYGVLLDPNNLKQKPAPEVLSAAGADVDSPRLVARPGGYWLAVARALDAAKPKAKPRPGDSSTDLAEDDSLLDVGTRRIELMKLDALGKPASSALVVTAPGARPIGFELAATADGGAYIAFRGDESTPGADAGALELVHVKADGSIEKVSLNGELGGTGTPTLLVDAAEPSALWLSAAGPDGATSFGRITDHAQLAVDGLVRGADLIARGGGRFLLARANGTAIDLSVTACDD